MESIWSSTCRPKERATLNGDIQADAVVIGGGMAGILTAYSLQRAGVRTVVLEAERIGGGQTKNTTAKITSQHGMFCSSFIEKKGKDTAEKYVQANQQAVEEYKKIIRREKIDCDLEEADSFVYFDDEEKLILEAEAAKELGVPSSLERNLEIPVSCAGAVRFDAQAQFHPLKFLSALAEGLTVYENSPVKVVEDDLVRTPCGTVRADKIIFATHYPFVNFPGIYFTRMHQERSYVLALEGAERVKGMYIGSGPDALSFRQYGKYLLLGGKAHRTGENKEGGRYAELREAARMLYPGSREAACWSAQDCITADQIPFIGQYASDRPHWLVATGFQKYILHGVSDDPAGYDLRTGEPICGYIFAGQVLIRRTPADHERQRKGCQGADKAFLSYTRRDHKPDRTGTCRCRGDCAGQGRRLQVRRKSGISGRHRLPSSGMRACMESGRKDMGLSLSRFPV